MASLDVSGDTDYGQGVDARKAKEQCEEAVYLEGNIKKGLMSHDISSKHL